jgi:hypothetical protein
MISAYLRKILTSAAMTLDGYDPYDDDVEVCVICNAYMRYNIYTYVLV